MAKVWVAAIESTVVGYVRVTTEGDEPPTEDDVFEAARYVDNHLDTIIGEEDIVSIEEY
jgi:hypothetical protein